MQYSTTLSVAAGDLAEEQRALATLGRTYFVQSLSGEVGEEEARELRLQAGNANLKSLDVCDKLGGVVPERWVTAVHSNELHVYLHNIALHYYMYMYIQRPVIITLNLLSCMQP